MEIDLLLKALEEQFNEVYKEMNKRLALALLNRIKLEAPEFLERVVLDLLCCIYCGTKRTASTTQTGRTHDKGIDGIITIDELGLFRIYFQAKRWNTPVGRPDLQAFAGALDGQQANLGVFVTTSTFWNTAEKYAKGISKNIVLVNGEQLAYLMIKYEIGVSTIATYSLKKIAADYFIS